VKIEYVSLKFIIQFPIKVSFNKFPAFIFRSILGKELRFLSCHFREKSCNYCSLQNICAYSVVFETPIHKNNSIVEGRNKVSHPYTMYTGVNMFTKVDMVPLYITLFGKGSEYIPHIYFSLLRAGSKGIFKSRIPFRVMDVIANDKKIMDEKGDLNVKIEKKVWTMDKNMKKSNYNIGADIKTPVRMKVRGKYSIDFSAEDLFRAIYRRASILSFMYGKIIDLETCHEFDFRHTGVFKKELRWIDYSYFSARQRTEMKIGGVIGKIFIEDVLSDFEVSLLKFAELFHVGKNVSFGFGKIKFAELN